MRRITIWVCATSAGLFVLALAGCTESNPGYEPPRDLGTSCTPGQRSCAGQNVMVCLPRTSGAGFEVERVCPGGATCKSGLCIPQGPSCSGGCSDGQVCTVFVVPNGSAKLGLYCAAVVGTKGAGAPCAKDGECQTGLCVGRSKGSVCFRACAPQKDCGGSLRCTELTLTVNGVQGTITGCVPP